MKVRLLLNSSSPKHEAETRAFFSLFAWLCTDLMQEENVSKTERTIYLTTTLFKAFQKQHKKRKESKYFCHVPIV